MSGEKKFNRYLATLLIIITLLTTVLPIQPTNAAVSDKITVKNYTVLLLKAMKLEVKNKQYIKTAIDKKLLKESELYKLNSNITNQFAATLTDRADRITLGKKYSYDKVLYQEIVSKHRISDINNANSNCISAIHRMFEKGIMVGYSNGKYTHTRSIKPTRALKLAEAKVILKRLAHKAYRKKISPDGQVIRTTNLPKNYKAYKYILESFPNSFYEYKFLYQRTKYYYKPVELKDYASPKRVFDRMGDKEVFQNGRFIYLDDWMKKVELNLKTRLNVDYRTIDNIWLNNLRGTYFIYGDADLDKDKTDDIKEYIRNVKKNKIVIKSSIISVEPSSMYFSRAYRVRVYVKFKIKFADDRLKQEDSIYGNLINLFDLKKDKWFEGVYDIEFATINGRSDGSDYAVSDDSLNDYLFKTK